MPTVKSIINTNNSDNSDQFDNNESNELHSINQTNDIHQANPKHSYWWHTPFSAFFGGATGGYLCFAFEGLKKRMQSNQVVSKASFHPKELFRGSTSFAISVGSTSVAQFTIQKLLRNLPNHDPSSATWNMATAIASGMCGAFFSTAVENIILTQQLMKSGPATAIYELFKQGYTRPWLGLPELTFREGGFALMMLYLASAVGEYVRSQTNNNTTAVYSSEIGLGVTGALLTHPFDTLATHKQKYLVSTRTAFNSIYNEKGAAGFYKGVGYRAMLFTGCMLVIPYSEQKARQGLINFSLFCSQPSPHQSLKEQEMELRKNIRSHA